jgi:hypothetical protein
LVVLRRARRGDLRLGELDLGVGGVPGRAQYFYESDARKAVVSSRGSQNSSRANGTTPRTSCRFSRYHPERPSTPRHRTAHRASFERDPHVGRRALVPHVRHLCRADPGSAAGCRQHSARQS